MGQNQKHGCWGGSDTNKWNDRPHYNQPVVFFSDGLGWQPPISWTRFCATQRNHLKVARQVPLLEMFSLVFRWFLSSFWKYGYHCYRDNTVFFNEPNLYLILMAPLKSIFLAAIVKTIKIKSVLCWSLASHRVAKFDVYLKRVRDTSFKSVILQ